MGMSADARLVFGMRLRGSDDWDDEIPALPGTDDENYDGGFELASYLAARAGLEDPYKTYAEVIDPMSYGEYQLWCENEGQWFAKVAKEWSVVKRKLENEAPVELVHVGYHNVSVPILVLKNTEVWAYDYTPVYVDLNELCAKVTPEAVKTAQEWCKEYGLPFNDPRWWLAPSYG